MPRVPTAVAEAAREAGLGYPRERYPGPIGFNVYFGLVAAVFALCPGIAGAPWYISLVPALASVALLALAVVTRLNKAAFVYESGLVVTALNRRIKLAARWAEIANIEWVDRKVFFFFTLTTLRRTEYAIRLAGGRGATFTTGYRDDAGALPHVITDKLV